MTDATEPADMPTAEQFEEGIAALSAQINRAVSEWLVGAPEAIRSTFNLYVVMTCLNLERDNAMQSSLNRMTEGMRPSHALQTAASMLLYEIQRTAREHPVMADTILAAMARSMSRIADEMSPVCPIHGCKECESEIEIDARMKM